mmetsp:Transcript_7998/g.36285  ORF Transcript_7998/g.36285 Transcript_7998/m.36285 type:complete len:244 (+) Transcript_7998:2186-2917(+)
MHLPSACRWRLIAMASSNVWPSAPLFPTRSLPARSTRSSLPFSTLTLRSFVGAFDAFIVDAFVDAFVVVSEPSAPRPTRPTFRRTVTDSNACDLDDAALSKWFATARFRSPSRSVRIALAKLVTSAVLAPTAHTSPVDGSSRTSRGLAASRADVARRSYAASRYTCTYCNVTWELCAPSAAQTRRMRSSALATTPRSSPAHPPKAFRVGTNGFWFWFWFSSREDSDASGFTGPDIVYVFPVPV